MFMARVGGCVAAVLLLSLAAPPRAQQPFRAGTNVVPVYATVTDSRGALVTDLTAGAFQVQDDGRSQKITVFKSDVEPIALAILVDASPSVLALMPRIRAALDALIARLLPDDRVCLGTFSHVVTLDPALTAEKSRLIKHLGDDAPFAAGTAVWDAVDAGRRALTAEGGRRVVLVITDAADNSSASDLMTVRTAVERDGVMVYSIGLRGRDGLPASEMRALTRATGGWHFELKPGDDVGASMARVADELHRQYVLGFTPRALDDRVHRISVKVIKPGLTVRARRAYFASREANVR